MYVSPTDWGAAEEDAEDINVWEDNWDDDNIEDDFSQQLRCVCVCVCVCVWVGGWMTDGSKLRS